MLLEERSSEVAVYVEASGCQKQRQRLVSKKVWRVRKETMEKILQREQPDSHYISRTTCSPVSRKSYLHGQLTLPMRGPCSRVSPGCGQTRERFVLRCAGSARMYLSRFRAPRVHDAGISSPEIALGDVPSFVLGLLPGHTSTRSMADGSFWLLVSCLQVGGATMLSAHPTLTGVCCVVSVA